MLYLCHAVGGCIPCRPNSAATFLVSYGGRSRNCCWGDLIPFLSPLSPLSSSSRSSDVSSCVVSCTHTGFGDRAFQVAGPRLWNSLPVSLRQSDTTVGQFKKLLKTHLFSWDCGALVTVAFTAPCINISTTTTSLPWNRRVYGGAPSVARWGFMAVT